MSVFFMNIQSWDPVTPVTLPIGALNATPFVHASYGIFPFCVVFMAAAYAHIYHKWTAQPVKLEGVATV
jgi:hypothetical protein